MSEQLLLLVRVSKPEYNALVNKNWTQILNITSV